MGLLAQTVAYLSCSWLRNSSSASCEELSPSGTPCDCCCGDTRTNRSLATQEEQQTYNSVIKNEFQTNINVLSQFLFHFPYIQCSSGVIETIGGMRWYKFMWIKMDCVRFVIIGDNFRPVFAVEGNVRADA